MLVHDSVSPLVTQELISHNIEDVRKFGNAITVIRPTETFVVEENNGRHRRLERNDIHVVRAPQSFRLDKILGLHERALADGKRTYKDCCSMMCDYGMAFHETEGPTTNIKITIPSDILLFRSLIELREVRTMLGMKPNEE